ncbi:hypothetical protein MMSR116_05955 [Methylobacterium mesophilicum SR1.6/6]|uniref:Uncharacterized protein n=1 Tax=Methylobacterium mesophilicum SR1.6/6 TaxID=908290 RepID=A0A6B9FFY7_9HYPH|nr:hypothetical protein [Methylobacterium mesophilicum]QGY01497.1 hypothetical protein MMSR116_05955 [Methylobacterium mesophilicum SR1.6/6]
MAAGSVIAPPFASTASPMHTASEKRVRQSRPNIGQLSGIDHEIIAARVAAFLKHRHPHNTAKYVAREIDVPRDTVAKWIERGSAPNAEGILKLIAVYKTDLLIALLGGAEQWLAVAAWHERRARFEAEQAAFLAEMGPLLFGEDQP